MANSIVGQLDRAEFSAGTVPPVYLLAAVGTISACLTLATPFAFQAGGDNAFIALAIVASLLALAATHVAERAPTARALWLILGLGIALRGYVLFFDPLLSSDIYRYVWDGKVQEAGINPYRYYPAEDVLAFLRDAVIFPQINRSNYAVTIYPPVAEFFFLVVNRIGESVNAMRLGLLACEAVSVTLIILFLRRLGRPVNRVVAYFWHPLPIWEIANSGHVDALAVALMLLGLWVALTGRTLRGAVLIAFAVLVKPYVAPVLAAIWRPWDWTIPLVVIGAIAFCYLPYLSVGSGVFGFLTKGYLAEEGIASGDKLWLLSVWRLVFGTTRGDVAVYAAMSAASLLFAALFVAHRRNRTLASALSGANALLLVVLLLLSPNYPWYFLAITPFLALCGGAPNWTVSIGALLLTNEVDWDFSIPMLTAKSILFGGFFLACIWSARGTYLAQDAGTGRLR